ncbi:hypothetical protein [Hymenobacter terricola]|nr:hypothetical protein [Hymenobacter terricola]
MKLKNPACSSQTGFKAEMDQQGFGVVDGRLVVYHQLGKVLSRAGP